MSDITDSISFPAEGTLSDYINMVKVEVPSDESLISLEEEELEEDSIWETVGSYAINLILPFINGMMLGFGEIAAHEVGFHYGWYGAKVEPKSRMQQKVFENNNINEEKSKWI